MSNHLPIRIIRPFYRQCTPRRIENRMFSTTPTRCRAKRIQDPQLAAAAVRHQESKAPRVVYQEQLADDQNLPEDFGLLPGTIIRQPIFPRGILRDTLSWTFQVDPSREAKPWHKKAWARIAYEGKYCFSKATAAWTTFRFRQSIDPRRRPPLFWWVWNRTVIYNIVKERYVFFYRSLARGDRAAILDMCLEGVAKDACKLMETRKKRAEWELKKDGNFKMHIASNRAAPLGMDGYDATGIQQIVVRIRSTQLLLDDQVRKPVEVSENIVMQRQIVRGEAMKWKIWGFPEDGTSVATHGADDRQEPKGNDQLVEVS